MTTCTHLETCEDCFEANRKLKVEGSLRSGLAGRLNSLLGVQHLKGTPLLDAAVERVEALLKIEKFAAEMVKAEDSEPPLTREMIDLVMKEAVSNFEQDMTAQVTDLSPIGCADAERETV